MLGITTNDIEILSRRSLFGRTFDLGQGRLNTRVSSGPIHFFDKYHFADTVGAFQDLDFDLKWDDIRRGWTFEQNNFQPFIPEYADQQSDFFDCQGDKENHIRMTPVCNHVLGRLISVDELASVGLETETDAPCILYTDAFGTGIDLVYLHKRRGMSKLIRFRAGYYPTSDMQIRFAIDFGGEVYRAYGQDDFKNGQRNGAYKLDLTRPGKRFDSGKRCFIGDQERGYSIVEPFQIWERPSVVAVRQNRQLITADWIYENGKNYFVKNIPASFFENCSLDVYCDTTDTYYATNDGCLMNSATYDSYTWAQVLAGTGTITASSTYSYIRAFKYTGAGHTWNCYRGYFTFNTAALPDTDTISAASAFFYKNDGAGTYTVKMYGCSDYGTLGTSDWGAVNSTAQSDTSLTAISAGYNEFACNATGIASINKTGSTFFSLRRADHDVDGTDATTTDGYIITETSYYSGTSRDPYISITHAAVATGSRLVGESSLVGSCVLVGHSALIV